jgi:tetratricopeptide (TPR) repeat protein
MVMVRQADILFTEKRWSEAMDSYGNALRFAQENRVSDYDVVTRISSARHEAEINNCLEDAQALLAVNKDGEARNIFEKIITLSEENGVIDLAATAISREMIGKIDKNNFLVKINSLEEKAGKLRFEKKYEEALAYYQEMLAELAANAPKFQVNPASRKAMVKAAMAEINNQKVVSNQQSYLLSMYQNILRKNFNLSTNIQLKQPEVVFLKNENNVLIYKVTALGITDSNASVPQTRYEVDYKFDLGTGAWAIDADSAS